MSLASRSCFAWYLLQAGVLLVMFFNLEDGGNTFLETLVHFQHATQRYSLEDKNSSFKKCSAA
jgi:hypothetical protein